MISAAKRGAYLEHDGVPLNFPGFVVGIAVLVIEPAQAGTEDDSHHKSYHTSSHVNRARSRKVNGAATPEGILISVGKKAVDGPERVSDDWIKEGGEEGGVK